MDILCIDLKSFYASVECVLRGLDPYKVNLVVADISRGNGSICLAASPHLKSLGAKSRCRIYELPKNVDIIYAKPRMKKYIEYSSMIYNIYLNYVDREDIHVYSIDEAFLDLTSYLKYYKKSLYEIAQEILKEIYYKTKITATCGMGDNMFLAKVALDVLAKHKPDNIAYLDQKTFFKEIWDHKPISDIWGIGRQTEKRLAKMNIYSLRQLAHYSLEKLEKEFGVMGIELFEHANGIDKSVVREIRNYKPTSKSIGHSQVLFEDYNYKDLYTILIESVEDIATELVTRKICCQVIGLAIGYSKEIGGGFSRQMSFDSPTNSKKILLDGFSKLYYDNIEDYPIRTIGLRVGKLSYEKFIQTDLFTDTEKLKKEHDLYEAIGNIKEKYGKGAIHMAISHTEKATRLKRDKLIGGHNAE